MSWGTRQQDLQLQNIKNQPRGFQVYYFLPLCTHFCLPFQAKLAFQCYLEGYHAISNRMNWWYSTRCDLYRSVRNDVKLTKCHEMLWCEAAWGQLWPILCYEAGHKWTQPTLQCTSCAVCIGRHNCRHYNWLAAVSVLGCLQKQKKHFFHHLHFKIKLVYYDGFSV